MAAHDVFLEQLQARLLPALIEYGAGEAARILHAQCMLDVGPGFHPVRLRVQAIVSCPAAVPIAFRSRDLVSPEYLGPCGCGQSSPTLRASWAVHFNTRLGRQICNFGLLAE